MSVKIILREHVDRLGERGEIVSVAPGYARNFLLPKGLAMLATPGNLKQVESQRRTWAAKEAKDVEAAQALADRIAAVELKITRKAGETGTLYGSVTNVDLADHLADAGVEVDRKRIQLDDPIKTIGEYEVPVKLHRQVNAQIKVSVVPEATVE